MLISDNAIAGVADDEFGFRAHAAVLCDAMRAAPDLPVTIGVFGSWGTGKSSFMNVCKDILEGDGVSTISFNPWKYDQKDEIWHALIQTVVNELAHRMEQAEDGDDGRVAKLHRAVATARRLSQAASWLLARRLAGVATGGLVAMDDIDQVSSAWNELQAQEYRHVNQFEQDFADVVEAYTGGGRLVVFVDDLDRCTPEAAVTVLDSLKLYLGEGRCVFVLAMDHAVVAEAVANKLGGDVVRGRHYLEKLVQLPYHLPRIPQTALFRSLRSSVLRLADERELWEIVNVAFGANPRRVRRFVNALNIAISTLSLRSEPSRDRLLQLAALLVIRTEHVAFFDHLQEHPGAWAVVQNEVTREASGLFSPDVEKHTAEDRSLAPFLEATAPNRRGFDFPPPPSPHEIESLTEVVTVASGALAGEVPA